jgi:hypothetical protein
MSRCAFLRLSASCRYPKFLDDRPPFLGASLHHRAKRLQCVLLARENFNPEIGEARSHHWIGKCLHGRRIEFADDVLGRALWREGFSG